MKILAQMNGVVRISTIAVILCVAIIGSSLVYKNGTAHACGNSIVSASTTTIDSSYGTVIFSLWYNSCNSQNFTSANVTYGTAKGLTVGTYRGSGPDGPANFVVNYDCPLTGICNSPGSYSPNNPAAASVNPFGEWVTTSYF